MPPLAGMHTDDDEDEADMPSMRDSIDEATDGMTPTTAHATSDTRDDYLGLGRAQRAIAQSYGVALEELQCLVLYSGARPRLLSVGLGGGWVAALWVWFS